MGSNGCMNVVCRVTTSSEWKTGWSLKSGGLARLCFSCGSLYENSIFCETFHLDESGWRKCRICGKMIHCGCIMSKYLHELMDFGGVRCISCAKSSQIQTMPSNQMPGQSFNCAFPSNGVGDLQAVGGGADDEKIAERLLQLTKAIGSFDMNSRIDEVQKEESILSNRESNNVIANIVQGSTISFIEPDNSTRKEGVGGKYGSTSQNFPLMAPFGCSSPVTHLFGGIIEGGNLEKGSFQLGQKAPHKPSKSLKPSQKPGAETNKAVRSQKRAPRSPAEGQYRNHLLPRYWPRITDQELQQLSGHLKSTIVPLFEKILSASDAGRIGRLVLPKACAEAYFPPINQSEGTAIKVQDIKGNEWTFQFRFWPNNNSRMYVLEGVTLCMQNMQVQAGDTVTFSRIEPGGQLVIGCRKATNNSEVKDTVTDSLQNSGTPAETSLLGGADNPLFNGDKVSTDSIQHHLATCEKKKARKVNKKRPFLPSNVAMELRITWEEAQGLLRPSPTSIPSITMVENHEFQEYDEAPILGKKTIFSTGPRGDPEQWAQCDSCLQWRRLPVHALLSARWTCSEDIWDKKRSSCSAPEDISPVKTEHNIGTHSESKKQKHSEKSEPREEPSGLDALANAAVLGEAVDSSTGATTRHPRHRPGCSCIVCIQPPSGKGKHESTCKCTVCNTVRRRFKTMQSRKKQLQQQPPDRVPEIGPESNAHHVLTGARSHVEETSKCELDLNIDPPRREDDAPEEVAASTSATATAPLEIKEMKDVL